MMTPVASRMREVWAARKVKATMGSSSRMSGAIGRPGTGGSGSTTWSATQSDSKPAASAARPTRAAASGYPQVWRLTECSPNFIAGRSLSEGRRGSAEVPDALRRARPAGVLGLDAERRHRLHGGLLRFGGLAVLAHLRDLFDLHPGSVAGFIRTNANLGVDLGHPLVAVAHRLLSEPRSREPRQADKGQDHSDCPRHVITSPLCEIDRRGVGLPADRASARPRCRAHDSVGRQYLSRWSDRG